MFSSCQMYNVDVLQRKDAKLYGEAGDTGSWRGQTPFHILKAGQVGCCLVSLSLVVGF